MQSSEREEVEQDCGSQVRGNGNVRESPEIGRARLSTPQLARDDEFEEKDARDGVEEKDARDDRRGLRHEAWLWFCKWDDLAFAGKGEVPTSPHIQHHGPTQVIVDQQATTYASIADAETKCSIAKVQCYHLREKSDEWFSRLDITIKKLWRKRTAADSKGKREWGPVHSPISRDNHRTPAVLMRVGHMCLANYGLAGLDYGS
ncbi:hypothetical protein BDN72DRAFT_861884 [Pluteus cervinus]|uniref:Uncharacterized protein n=1 Tax=Pluteus cervinus TaxID=181527 RepID=A0ACD3ADK4_9AGAR|nr:hypothetical protein BDN72DRAFT_861884 [Pluteus cervinus]